MTIRLEIHHNSGTGIRLIAADEVEQRDVRSIEDMRRLLSDRGESLTERQHHGLGLVTAVLALGEYGCTIDQLGKVLDAVYFPATNPGSGQAFSRGVGEGTFALRRAESLDTATVALLEDAQRNFDESGATP